MNREQKIFLSLLVAVLAMASFVLGVPVVFEALLIGSFVIVCALMLWYDASPHRPVNEVDPFTGHGPPSPTS